MKKNNIDTEYIIADTSGIVSLVNDYDSNHNLSIIAAKSIYNKGFIIVSCEVFSEIINIVGKKIDKESAVQTGKMLLNSTTFVIKESNQKIRNNALLKFQKLSNSVSFTDCIVMSFSDYYQLENKYIFGFDKIFKKEGYNIIE